MDLHTVIEAIGGMSLLTAAGYLWKASARFTTMANDISGVKSDIAEMKSNHLPHLSEDIGKVSDKLDRHIEWHATGGRQ